MKELSVTLPYNQYLELNGQLYCQSSFVKNNPFIGSMTS